MKENLLMEDLNKSLEKVICVVEKLSEAPDQLFETNAELSTHLKDQLKVLYDHCKRAEIKKNDSEALPELIILNFDSEQIWQQLELQNESVLKNAVVDIGSLLTKKECLNFHGSKKEIAEENDELLREEVEDDISEVNEDSSGEFDETDAEESPEEPNTDLHRKNTKGSVVDDEFFKLHEMEEFLNAEERKIDPDSGNNLDLDLSDSEASIDLFAEESEDSEDTKVRLAKYKEFFRAKQQESSKKPKKTKFLEEFSDVEDENNQLSTLELRHKRLKQKIEDIESTAVSEKPWQLQGEIKGDSRPQNSLLQEIVDFDRTTRPAPILTGQTTILLEDIIKQRIKDKVFDSVERKVKPVETLQEYKKKLVLDQEKSKASLAQIYEKEYLEQQSALDPEHAEKEEEEPPLHKEVKSMMATLFSQLDALSNYHYTPKPAIPELKIISNIAAINMEEVAPVAASDAALLAPEEVKAKPKCEILGKSERTTTDKNRERRSKKSKQRHHAKEKEKREKLLQKIKPGMGNKYSKEKARQFLEKATKEGGNIEKMDESVGHKAVKSSTAFFTQLQEQVKSQIKSKNENKRAKNNNRYNAKKLKL